MRPLDREQPTTSVLFKSPLPAESCSERRSGDRAGSESSPAPIFLWRGLREGERRRGSCKPSHLFQNSSRFPFLLFLSFLSSKMEPEGKSMQTPPDKEKRRKENRQKRKKDGLSGVNPGPFCNDDSKQLFCVRRAVILVNAAVEQTHCHCFHAPAKTQ